MIIEYRSCKYKTRYRTNRRRERKRKQRQLILLCIVFICGLLTAFILYWNKLDVKVDVESFPFTESAKELKNPNRGFYHLYSFWITDEEVNYQQLVEEKYQDDTDTELTLVQICLQAYRESLISETGLTNIEHLFCALETLDKQLIIRFMYDGEGLNELYEPERLDIILQHMQQLEPILSKPERHIFILQGLFTGNWGEMNGTRYSSVEDMRQLASQLVSVTNQSTYLAVRIPAQWRSIVQSLDLSEEVLSNNLLESRLGLFNDGMLGNESDYGTYSTVEIGGTDELARWNREEELEFQRELCSDVPNGGEVINDNFYNDFENAVKDLSTMHVTYLNKDYDQAVLKKWEKKQVTEDSCFWGMDGCTYIERHLGYRLFITDADLIYNTEKNYVYAAITLKNTGFAPLYKEPEITTVLYNEEEGYQTFEMESYSLRNLVGGEESENLYTVYGKVSLKGLSKTNYSVYFFLKDSDSDKPILLANEEMADENGYCIGTINLY